MWLVLAICLLVLPPAARAQSCGPTLSLVGSWTNSRVGDVSGWDIAVEGGYAYLLHRNELVVVDISNPAYPDSVASLPLTGNACLRIRTRPGVAYVASNTEGVFVIDTTDPTAPSIVRTLPNGHSELAWDIFVSGNSLFVARTLIGTLQRFDITDPLNPQLQSSISGPYESIAVQGTLACATSNFNSYASYFDVIDISNPGVLAKIGSLRIYPDTRRAQGMEIRGNYAFVGGYPHMSVIDISNPANPQHVGSFPGQWFLSGGDGDFLYAGNETGLVLLDYQTSPGSLIESGRFSGGPCSYSAHASDRVFAGSYGGSSSLVVLQQDPRPCISGAVLDAQNLGGIGHATVRATIAGQTTPCANTVSDQDGNYRLCVQPGTYQLTFSHTGYLEQTRTVNVLNNSIEVPVHLNTRTVVLVHGIFGDASVWNDFIPLLASLGSYHIQTVSMVQPSSAWMGAAGGVNAQTAEFVDALGGLRAQGIQSFDIVAHSMGGLVARRYIQQGGGRNVRKLVMLGTPNHGSEIASDVDAFARAASIIGGPVLQATAGVVTNSQARRDLEPNSDLLRGLNYGGQELAKSNWNCAVHPDESLPAGETEYYTYAATRGVPFLCNPLKWELGLVLAARTWCADNDGVVPSRSVPLMSGGSPRVVNYRDEDANVNCHGGHWQSTRAEGCLPMTKDPCVASLVHSMLQGYTPVPASQQAVTAESTSPGSENLLVRNLQIDPGAAAICSLTVGDADSMLVSASTVAGVGTFSLVTPAGQVLDPSTVIGNPGVVYETQPGYESYLIRGANGGLWQFVVGNSSASDTAFVGVDAFGYSGAHASMSLASPEISPGGAQLVTVAADHLGAPILGGSIAATVRSPDHSVTPFVASDDGVGADQTAGDGLYSALLSENLLSGPYVVNATLIASYGTAQSIVRDFEASYFVEDRPDLEVGSIVLTPALATGADSVRVATTIANLSATASAGSVRVRFLELTTGAVFDELMITDISAAGNLPISAHWTARDVPVHFSLGVSVDVLAQPGESNVSNNARFEELDIPAYIPPKEDPRVVPLPSKQPTISARPNPFNPQTEIAYEIPVSGHVELKVFNVSGQLVATLVDGRKAAGRHVVFWKAEQMASGVYFMRVSIGGRFAVKKLVLLK